MLRTTMIEPGAVHEFNDRITDVETEKKSEDNSNSMDALQAEDIAAAIMYAFTQPDRVAVNEILIHPTDQT